MISGSSDYLIFVEEKMGKRVYRISIPPLGNRGVAPSFELAKRDEKYRQA